MGNSNQEYGVWVSNIDGTNGYWLHTAGYVSHKPNPDYAWYGTLEDAKFYAEERALVYTHLRYEPKPRVTKAKG